MRALVSGEWCTLFCANKMPFKSTKNTRFHHQTLLMCRLNKDFDDEDKTFIPLLATEVIAHVHGVGVKAYYSTFL